MGQVTHRIYIEYDDDGNAYWECSCGHGGTSVSDRVDIASDRHIAEGDVRIDTNKPL